MNQTTTNALDVLVHAGERLGRAWYFSWPAAVQQTVYRLRLWQGQDDVPTLIAVMGGASSGKSTVFNNLLDGHLASRITARGHATRGPILAIHEEQRSLVEGLLAEGRLFTGLRVLPVELDDNVSGDPNAVALFYHHIDSLRGLLFCDMPDLTSQLSADEGEVALTLLPWFDRILVVVDHERWFDRQTISDLRGTSVRFGQERFVVFNRTREEELAPADETALRGQAERLAAQGMLVLGFRHGRGFCQFAPGALDEVIRFLSLDRPERETTLLRQVGEAANRVLNQNRERHVGLEQLQESLHAVVARTLPSTWDCMTAQMTTEERKQLEVVSRVFRLQETRHWLSTQTQRIQKALKGIPLVGLFVGSGRRTTEPPSAGTDRLSLTRGFYESVARRQLHEVQRLVRASEFWNELERWTGQTPKDRSFVWTTNSERALEEAVTTFEDVLKVWTEKIKTECQGISPKIHGAVGAGAIALIVVLVTVPGPVTALTLISAKGAIGAALAELLTASGAGALFGKHLKQLTSVIQEKLVGSPEFEAVQDAATHLRDLLEDAGRACVETVVSEANAYVMPPEEPMNTALETLRQESEAADA